MFAVANDITEQKNVDRLKQEFIEMISGELITPLAMLADDANWLLSATSADQLPTKNAKRDLEAIQRNSVKLEKLISNFIRVQSMPTAAVTSQKDTQDIRTLISEAVELVAALAAAKRIEIDVDDSPHEVLCDRQQIIQVVSNLLDNAIKFSPENGTIRVSFTESKDEPTDGADLLEVRVSDQGPGVPEQWRERIFHSFEQAPSKKEGTGLGLSICKMFVEAHDGTIGVRPNPGIHAGGTDGGEAAGSQFWFTLPKAWGMSPRSMP